MLQQLSQVIKVSTDIFILQIRNLKPLQETLGKKKTKHSKSQSQMSTPDSVSRENTEICLRCIESSQAVQMLEKLWQEVSVWTAW